MAGGHWGRGTESRPASAAFTAFTALAALSHGGAGRQVPAHCVPRSCRCPKAEPDRRPVRPAWATVAASPSAGSSPGQSTRRRPGPVTRAHVLRRQAPCFLHLPDPGLRGWSKPIFPRHGPRPALALVTLSGCGPACPSCPLSLAAGPSPGQPGAETGTRSGRALWPAGLASLGWEVSPAASKPEL